MSNIFAVSDPKPDLSNVQEIKGPELRFTMEQIARLFDVPAHMLDAKPYVPPTRWERILIWMKRRRFDFGIWLGSKIAGTELMRDDW